jgi:hypothetical protein
MSLVPISVNLKTLCGNFCIKLHPTFRSNSVWSLQYQFLLSSRTSMATAFDCRF